MTTASLGTTPLPTAQHPDVIGFGDLTGGSPLAYWKFDETSGTTAADSSGNGNTGTLLNGATFTTRKKNNALNCDGVNDYVKVTKNNAMWAARFTIQAWAKFTNFNTTQAVMEAWNAVEGKGVSLFYYQPNNSFYLQVKIGGTVYEVIKSAAGYSAGAWHHFSGVLDGNNTLRFYINGSEVGNAAASGAFQAPDSDLYIGSEPTYFIRFFNGAIDEVKIFGYAKTASEISFDASNP